METPCLDQRLQAAPRGRCTVIYGRRGVVRGGQQKCWRVPSTGASGTQAEAARDALLLPSQHLPSALLPDAFLGIDFTWEPQPKT